VSEVDPDMIAAIDAMEPAELLEGTCYACGSLGKVLVMARRMEVFGAKLALKGKVAKPSPMSDNITAEQMSQILWNPDDNRHSIEPNRRTPPPLPPRLIVTQSHAPQGTMTCQQRTHNSQD